MCLLVGVARRVRLVPLTRGRSPLRSPPFPALISRTRGLPAGARAVANSTAQAIERHLAPRRYRLDRDGRIAPRWSQQQAAAARAPTPACALLSLWSIDVDDAVENPAADGT